MRQTLDSVKYKSKNPSKKFFIERFQNKLLSLVKLTNANRVLDVGCGEGYLLSFLDSQIRNWYLEGFDISKELIGRAKQKLPFINLGVRDIYNCGYPDKAFDLVLNTEVLEHLEHPKRALSEIRRITKRWIILSVPNEPLFSLSNFLMGKYTKTFGNNPGHINRWREKDFVNLISNYFLITKIARPFPWLILLCEVRDENDS